MAKELTLRDGTPAMVWPLSPSDARGLAEYYRRLSDESRYHRFLSPVPALSDQMLQLLVADVDAVDHVALVLVAFTPAGTDHGIGVGRLIRYPDRPGCADVAVTVAEDWRGRGAASTLLTELLAQRPPGVTELSTYVTADNSPSLAMLRRLGPARVRPVGSGVLEVTVPLGDPPMPGGAADDPPAPNRSHLRG
jgi:RimJ/RimL family protein N-acetyltransferase